MLYFSYFTSSLSVCPSRVFDTAQNIAITYLDSVAYESYSVSDDLYCETLALLYPFLLDQLFCVLVRQKHVSVFGFTRFTVALLSTSKVLSYRNALRRTHLTKYAFGLAHLSFPYLCVSKLLHHVTQQCLSSRTDATVSFISAHLFLVSCSVLVR